MPNLAVLARTADARVQANQMGKEAGNAEWDVADLLKCMASFGLYALYKAYQSNQEEEQFSTVAPHIGSAQLESDLEHGEIKSKITLNGNDPSNTIVIQDVGNTESPAILISHTLGKEEGIRIEGITVSDYQKKCIAYVAAHSEKCINHENGQAIQKCVRQHTLNVLKELVSSDKPSEPEERSATIALDIAYRDIKNKNISVFTLEGQCIDLTESQNGVEISITSNDNSHSLKDTITDCTLQELQSKIKAKIPLEKYARNLLINPNNIKLNEAIKLHSALISILNLIKGSLDSIPGIVILGNLINSAEFSRESNKLEFSPEKGMSVSLQETSNGRIHVKIESEVPQRSVSKEINVQMSLAELHDAAKANYSDIYTSKVRSATVS